MALNANSIPRPKVTSGPKAPLLDDGAYPARLIYVIDLGLQPQRPYQGQEKPPAYELQTVYELSDEFMPGEDGEPDESKPRWMWDNFPIYSLDQDKAKSTKRYYALDPNEEKGGNWAELIGSPVNVAIIKSGEYNNVAGTSTMRPKEAAKLPELVNEPKIFDLDNPDIEVFLSLPQRLQDKIKGNLNYEGSVLQKRLAEHKGGAKTETKKTNPKPKEKEVVEEDSIPFETETDDGDEW